MGERTYHFVTRDLDGVRHRYPTGWGDEAFEALPYIAEYGCLPAGWHAYHLAASEIRSKGPRQRALAAMPTLDVRQFCAAPDLALARDVRQAAERRAREGQQFWAAVALAPIARHHQ